MELSVIKIMSRLSQSVINALLIFKFDNAKHLYITQLNCFGMFDEDYEGRRSRHNRIVFSS